MSLSKKENNTSGSLAIILLHVVPCVFFCRSARTTQWKDRVLREDLIRNQTRRQCRKTTTKTKSFPDVLMDCFPLSGNRFPSVQIVFMRVGKWSAGAKEFPFLGAHYKPHVSQHGRKWSSGNEVINHIGRESLILVAWNWAGFLEWFVRNNFSSVIFSGVGLIIG